MKQFISCLLFVSFVSVLACRDKQTCNCPCYDTAFQAPLYRGCGVDYCYGSLDDCNSVQALYHTIYQNIHYPVEARENGIEGTVKVSFDILQNGELTNFKIVSEHLGYGLEYAALQAAKSLAINGFCPARQDCSTIVYQYTLPLKFILPG